MLFRSSGAFRGKYHVLGGLLSALDGVGPEALRVSELVGRAPDRPDRLHLVRAVGAGAWLHVVVKHVGAHRSASTTDELWVSTAYRVGEASLRRLTKRITLLPNTLERQR